MTEYKMGCCNVTVLGLSELSIRK